MLFLKGEGVCLCAFQCVVVGMCMFVYVQLFKSALSDLWYLQKIVIGVAHVLDRKTQLTRD